MIRYSSPHWASTRDVSEFIIESNFFDFLFDFDVPCNLNRFDNRNYMRCYGYCRT